jgi:hypothetical protein
MPQGFNEFSSINGLASEGFSGGWNLKRVKEVRQLIEKAAVIMARMRKPGHSKNPQSERGERLLVGVVGARQTRGS